MLSNVDCLIHNGWPDICRQVLWITHQYWDMRDKLISNNGLLLKGSCIIIMGSLKESFLCDIQEEDPGITRIQLTTHCLIYCPLMDQDIEYYIKQCPTCIKLKPIQPVELPISHKLPQGPWQKIGPDFINLYTRRYVLVAGYFSKYPYVFHMYLNTANAVIGHLI